MSFSLIKKCYRGRSPIDAQDTQYEKLKNQLLTSSTILPILAIFDIPQRLGYQLPNQRKVDSPNGASKSP
jgi:hypothetical protein